MAQSLGLPDGGITDAHVSESAAIQGTKIASGTMPTDRLETQQQSYEVDCSAGGAVDGGQDALNARAIRLTGSPAGAYVYTMTGTPSAGLCAWIVRNETGQTANLDLDADAVSEHALAAGESVLAVRSSAGVQYLPVAAGGTIPDGSIDPSTKLSDADFGSYDITTNGFVGVGSGTRPTSGGVRLPIDTAITSRTSGGANIDLIKLNASNNTIVNSAGSTAIYANGTQKIVCTSSGIGFQGAGAFAKPTITGSRANLEEALKNLLAALASYGLITDSTTA